MSSSKAQPVQTPHDQPTKYRKVSQQASAPNNCDLYPRAMRDLVNETTEGAVLAKREPTVTRRAQTYHRQSMDEQQRMAASDPETLRCFYPNAARRSAPK
ncbi:hypothetical protein LPJ70_006222 [Coemansia sp. RSA 2708]|nr:hypothetical protein LPJ70_006222 [Coemansia sp. RSA 2708]